MRNVAMIIMFMIIIVFASVIKDLETKYDIALGVIILSAMLYVEFVLYVL